MKNDISKSELFKILGILLIPVGIIMIFTSTISTGIALICSGILLTIVGFFGKIKE